MWIRTQNRESLVSLNNIIKADKEANSKSKFPVWIPPTSTQTFTTPIILTLGEYDTAEQALEVLQQIEDRINEGCAYVYQMPTVEAVQTIIEGIKIIKDVNKDDENIKWF